MKTQSFSSILAKWVGDRRLVDCAELLGISKTQLGVLMKGEHVPWTRTVRRWAPILDQPVKELVAVVDRDRRLGDRRKRVTERKRRGRTVAA